MVKQHVSAKKMLSQSKTVQTHFSSKCSNTNTAVWFCPCLTSAKLKVLPRHWIQNWVLAYNGRRQANGSIDLPFQRSTMSDKEKQNRYQVDPNGSNMHSAEIHRFSMTFPSSQGTSSEMGQPQAARHCANTLSLHQGQLFQRKTLSLQAHVVGRGIKHNYTGLHNRFKPVETKIGAYSILNTWV